MSQFYCEACQKEVSTVPPVLGRSNRNHCAVCEKDYCNFHWQMHHKGNCPATASQLTQIEKLHEQLVKNATFLEAISTDDMQHIDVVVERNRIIEELVNVLKGTPCADATSESEPLENFVAFNIAIQKKIDIARLEGFEEALRLYAWWKDGVQYVGSCGITLTQARIDMKKGGG